MGVTIRDIAKECKVSTSTVSLVLHNRSNVREATRRKIMDAIRKLKYDPFMNMPLVNTIRTKSIGLVVPHAVNAMIPFYYRAIITLKVVTSRIGYDFKLYSEDDMEAKAIAGFHLGKGQLGCDGLVVFCPLRHWQEYVKNLAAWGVPVVLVRRQTSIKGVMTVTDNDHQGMTLVMEHLHRLGHRNIILAGRDMDTGFSPGRKKGYLDYVKEHALKSDPRLILELGTLQKSPGQAIKELINSSLSPTAVCCYGDDTAVHVIKSLAAAGIRVPGDMAVTGFTNDITAEIFHPGITSVNVPAEEMVEAACNLLINYPPGKCPVNASLEFGNTLVVRESCGAALK